MDAAVPVASMAAVIRASLAKRQHCARLHQAQRTERLHCELVPHLDQDQDLPQWMPGRLWAVG